MTRNLAAKHSGGIVVYDVNPNTLAAIQKEIPKVQVAKTVEEVAEKSRTVMTMLPASAHVEQVYRQLEKIVGPEHQLADSSTIDPLVAKDVSAMMIAKGALAVDSPVSGGVQGATAGTLSFMVGAPSKEGFESIKPVLQCMGKNIVHCGKNGAGQGAKLCNNMLLGITMIGLSEALYLGKQLGLDPVLLSGIINTSTGRSWSSEVNNPAPGALAGAPVDRAYVGGFVNRLIAKDLGLAMKAAHGVDVHPALGGVASQVYGHLASNEDWGSLDFSSVYKWMEEHNDEGFDGDDNARTVG
ncbi:3-hydroxyisobutyrate dehydrogenase [Hesseltinella vesiculosa]|uniref:3-hydroxyisobutyrate dehydrogenase n=1 Tax=Hesseltinella vesiculosa TaxID=101127 RepID=A0A1X2GVF3_9FUNG|nr:3-hydroxyisobutyrate dehydrogenase [Hesseltinella vesiculosa]